MLEEIKASDEELETVHKNISEAKSQLQAIKKETAAVEIEKEKNTAKISELIALEKNMLSKLSLLKKESGEIGKTEQESEN